MDPRHHHNPPAHHQPSPPPPQPAHYAPFHHQPSSPPPQPIHHAPTYHQPSPPPPQPAHHAPTYHQPTPQPPFVSHHTPPHHQQSPSPPQPAAIVHHVSHQTTHETPHKPKYTDNKPTVRFYCKKKTDYSLTIRDGSVVLAPTNPSDPHQHWIKDEKFSTRVKDKEGFPSFALVNKATGQALKHATGASKPVQLTEYNPDKLDESVLWSQSKDLGDGFRTVRMVNNIELNLDASLGEVGIHDGTKVLLWKWTKGDNQRWTIAPFCKFL